MLSFRSLVSIIMSVPSDGLYVKKAATSVIHLQKNRSVGLVQIELKNCRRHSLSKTLIGSLLKWNILIQDRKWLALSEPFLFDF